MDVQVHEGILWETFVDDVKTAMVHCGLCVDKNEIDLLLINAIDVNDGESEKIDSMKKLERSCTKLKDELKIEVICDIISSISSSQGIHGAINIVSNERHIVVALNIQKL